MNKNKIPRLLFIVAVFILTGFKENKNACDLQKIGGAAQ
jgi:hypothetical protein